MGYGLPSFSSKTPLSAAALNQLTDSVDWQHDRTPYTFDLDGDLISNSDGIGEVIGYLPVDPTTYPGWTNPGGVLSCGQFTVDLPAIFAGSDCLTIQIQIATGTNGAMTATVSAEDENSFAVYVNDPGGTAIAPFALWVYAKGKLKPGVL